MGEVIEGRFRIVYYEIDDDCFCFKIIGCYLCLCNVRYCKCLCLVVVFCVFLRSNLECCDDVCVKFCVVFNISFVSKGNCGCVVGLDFCNSGFECYGCISGIVVSGVCYCICDFNCYCIVNVNSYICVCGVGFVIFLNDCCISGNWYVYGFGECDSVSSWCGWFVKNIF